MNLLGLELGFWEIWMNEWICRGRPVPFSIWDIFAFGKIENGVGDWVAFTFNSWTWKKIHFRKYRRLAEIFMIQGRFDIPLAIIFIIVLSGLAGISRDRHVATEREAQGYHRLEGKENRFLPQNENQGERNHRNRTLSAHLLQRMKLNKKQVTTLRYSLFPHWTRLMVFEYSYCIRHK